MSRVETYGFFERTDGASEVFDAAKVTALQVAPVGVQVMSLPREMGERYDGPFASAAKLHQAGVKFCLRSKEASNTRNLPYEAATAVAYGLPPDEALKAVTLNAAEIRLDAPIGDSEDSQLVERFITEEAAEPELEVESRLLTETVTEALSTLEALAQGEDRAVARRAMRAAAAHADAMGFSLSWVEADRIAAADQVQRTAVVVSGGIPEYTQIVDRILERGPEGVTIHEVSGQEDDAARVVAEIESAKPDRLIAIGLPAAVVARRVAGMPMIFCQVYNYQDHDLLSATSKGVRFLPPFDLQLEAWRKLAPSLRRIGIVTGPGQEALIGEIREDVARFGVELTVRTVRSDQEALLAFKEIAPEIDGLWLLPDNRILSPDVVREILAYGTRYRKQLAVFGDNLLDMGALGIICPNVSTRAEAEAFVRACRFPPLGERSVGGAGALQGYRQTPLGEVNKQGNASTTLIAMLETPEGIASADAIASVNGIDMLLMGAYAHSPLRSLLFGSKTTDLLRAATIPTLLLR